MPEDIDRIAAGVPEDPNAPIGDYGRPPGEPVIQTVYQTEKSVDQMLAFWHAAELHKHVVVTRSVISEEPVLILSERELSDEEITQFVAQQEASIRDEG